MGHRRLAGVIIIISLVEILELSLIFGWAKQRIEYALIKRYEDVRKHSLDMVMDGIKSDIAGTVDKLQIGSSIEAIKNTSLLCDNALKEIYPSFDDRVDAINRADTDAKVLCTSSDENKGIDLDKKQPHIAKILNEIDHPVVMGRIRRSPVDERPVMGIHVPVFRNGNFDGTLSAPIYLDRVKDVYLKTVIDYPSTRIFLKDDNGDYIYRSQGSDKATANETAFSVNREVFPGRFWRLTAYSSKSEIIGTVERSADITSQMKFSSRIFILLLMSLVTGTVIMVTLSKRF